MAFCELRGPDEYAFLEARNYGSHNLQCKALCLEVLVGKVMLVLL